MSKRDGQQTVTVRMPVELHTRLIGEAWARQMSLNRFCVALLAGEALPEPIGPTPAYRLPHGVRDIQGILRPSRHKAETPPPDGPRRRLVRGRWAFISTVRFASRS